MIITLKACTLIAYSWNNAMKHLKDVRLLIRWVTNSPVQHMFSCDKIQYVLSRSVYNTKCIKTLIIVCGFGINDID